jgi:drug/metabolite transporter (DMT)-like permease
MAAVLALASAVLWGAADFAGGVASRRASARGVVAISQGAGLVVVVALLPVLGGTPRAADLGWGAAAGLAGVLGLVLFYEALARGSMSVVAPVTALCAAAVPVLVGLALGERLAPVTAAGIGLALVAVLLVAAEEGLGSLQSVRPAALGPALVAGTAFGCFFALLARTHAAAGLWPLAAARLVSVTVLVLISLAGHRSLRVPGPVVPLAAVSGVGDMIANALFLGAAHLGQLAVTGVLASLYPATTVLLAQLVLRERLVRTQAAGLAAATAAVVLISLPA